MGGSQSTSSSRAAKFSGNGASRRSVRAVRSAPATDPTHRRATSVRNTNRNVKEFSKFWSDAGSVTRSKSSNRQSTKRSTNPNNNNGGNVRRTRTQSVDVRRASHSQCLNVPSGSSSAQRDRSPNQKRASSFRQSPTPSRKNEEHAPVQRAKTAGEPATTTTTAGRSDIYSPDFNDALIAAAHLRRLSLIPADQPPPPSYSHHQHHHQPLNRPLTSTHSSPYASYHQNINPPNDQTSPETAIY